MTRTIGEIAKFVTSKNAGPFLLTLEEDTRFEQATPRAVRVGGTRWVPAPAYTLKLEGAPAWASGR